MFIQHSLWRYVRTMRGTVGFAVACFIFAVFSTGPAQAMKIQKVVSPQGIEAWLVEDHTLPMISMQFGFRGGCAQDPTGKEGLGYFVSGMMNEGAGDIKSQEFQEKLESLAIGMSFNASRDSVVGSLKTLTKNKDEAFRLLRLALSEPRMDQDAVDRVRGQISSIIKMDQENPEEIAAKAWFKMAFGTHPYARPTKGDLDTIAKITPADLKAYVKHNFARESMLVAVVGDITAADLAKALDEIFGALPAKPELQPIPEVTWPEQGESRVISLKVPQSVVTFGQPGLKRKDKDFIAAYILNYIIGGGGFSSRLMEEVREKRGLAYSVYTYLYPLDHAGIMLGGVATKNKAVKQSIEIIKQELKRIAESGPTSEELDNAKRYLTGSYALRFSSSTRIASMLLGIQFENLGIDYIDRRAGMIEAVTLDDVKRVAKDLIQPGKLIITVVGQPDGLEGAEKSPAHSAPQPAAHDG
jgi:zinc protease